MPVTGAAGIYGSSVSALCQSDLSGHFHQVAALTAWKRHCNSDIRLLGLHNGGAVAPLRSCIPVLTTTAGVDLLTHGHKLFAAMRVQLVRTVLGVVLLASASSAEGDSKWVWSGRGRSLSGDREPSYLAGEPGRPLYR
jgi:hypothetical protein